MTVLFFSPSVENPAGFSHPTCAGSEPMAREAALSFPTASTSGARRCRAAGCVVNESRRQRWNAEFASVPALHLEGKQEPRPGQTTSAAPGLTDAESPRGEATGQGVLGLAADRSVGALAPTLNAERTPLEAPLSLKESGHPCHHDHRGVLRLPAGSVARSRSTRKDRNRHPALVRAFAGHREVALRAGMAGVGRDRHAGVRLEPMPGVPVDDGLLVRRLELVRDPASEPVPDSVARAAVVDVACSGQVDRRLHRSAVRHAFRGVGIPPVARLVLTEAAA